MFSHIFRCIFSKRFKATLLLFAAMMVLFTLLRFVFMMSNYIHYTEYSSANIIVAFLRGLRFDTAGILICNLPVMLIYNFPYNLQRYKIARSITYALFFLINSLALLVTIADTEYYSATGRRIIYELYVMSGDVYNIFPQLITEHIIIFFLFIAFIVAFFIIFRTLYRFSDSRLVKGRNAITPYISFLLLGLLVIVGIRGGFQMKPLRQANAFVSDSSPLSYLAMNTPYNIVNSFFQESLPVYNFFEDSVATDLTRGIVKDMNEVFIDDNFPFMRKRNSAGLSKKPNIVIFIMESWSARYCGAITGGKTFTPFFDSLAEGGMLFTNFFANGQRSIESVPSIFTSVPSLFNASIINSKAEMIRFRGIGEILREQGYKTSFHHGAATGSMGFDAFTRIAGFEHYYGKEDCQNLTEDDYDGMWGVCDEPFFLETGRVISTFQIPFCSVVFSLSSHDPYRIPDKRKYLLEQFPYDNDYELSVRYSDLSLREFFIYARKQPWFDNTIFIITADHTNYLERPDFYSTFHIPCLIYSPMQIKAEVNSLISSHVDILPTILDLLNINTVHSSMGKSMLSLDTNRCCFVKFNNEFVIINGRYALFNNLDGSVKLLNCTTNDPIEDDLIIDVLNKKLQAYLQTVSNSVVKDRVYKNIWQSNHESK